jgi:hypothetical protein
VRKSRTPGSVRGYPVTGIPTATTGGLRFYFFTSSDGFTAKKGGVMRRDCPQRSSLYAPAQRSPH